ncbi:hypothetical protein PENDEC_c035G04638 [Penicillium decumbens]|uniref:BZIP domain-containing protein n=1 Tax=Penicillium decumbens TaxID=69771 RepID=A0A1V6NUR6_PENDC|nr:hypothetical protein PENDEC_c035G04638 [Penicillium decumbens]
MKAEKTPESPNSDDSPGQKEDPLERRRLQNRLSQRNHRRKIRDRIAKLQERVIANELRAAAAFNGWDQHFGPSPLFSTRHISPSSHFNMNARQPLATDPTPFAQPYAPASPWPRNMALPASPGLLAGNQPSFIDGSFSAESRCSVPLASDWVGNAGIQVSGSSNEDIFQDIFATGDCLRNDVSNNLSNQPLYYVATGEPFQNTSQNKSRGRQLINGIQKQHYLKSSKC